MIDNLEDFPSSAFEGQIRGEEFSSQSSACGLDLNISPTKDITVQQKAVFFILSAFVCTYVLMKVITTFSETDLKIWLLFVNS